MLIYDYIIQTTKRQEMKDLTAMIEDALSKSGIRNGKMTLFCPHTTAGLTINENGDPDVKRDILKTLEELIPTAGDYRHFEGNSHAHLKSSIMGVDQTVFIQEGKCLLGTWQSVYFCEFDGPRQRTLHIALEE